MIRMHAYLIIFVAINRYTALVENNVLQAAKDMEKVLDVPMSQIAEDAVLLPDATSNNDYPLLSKQFFRRHGRDLFACASTWFLVDIVFYSSQLFQSQIYAGYLPHKPHNVYQDAYNVARLQAIVACSSKLYHLKEMKVYQKRFCIIKSPDFRYATPDTFSATPELLEGLLQGEPRYTALVENNVVQAAKDMEKVLDVSMSQIAEDAVFLPDATSNNDYPLLSRKFFRRHGRDLFACASTWFLVDIVFYSSQLFQIQIYAGYLPHKPQNVYQDAYNVARLQAIVAVSALVILGGVCIVGMVITYFFTRETMGRSLEENENENDEYAEMCVLRCFKGSCAVPPQSSVAAV
ncbi:hypothetical protein RJ639_022108 [Escallonia herrerae]|uniref:Uncharacterized protein n=1 Tax=Escallonia herrerae TaxID=1293975 RepID=A0AA88V710_9ASTE|nr:hypothetical protein RJ639_022108 [Escallonia herrerae]